MTVARTDGVAGVALSGGAVFSRAGCAAHQAPLALFLPPQLQDGGSGRRWAAQKMGKD